MLPIRLLAGWNISEQEFHEHWLATVKEGEEKGICLLLQPTPDFYQDKDEKVSRTGFSFVLNYLKPYRKLVDQLLLGIFSGKFHSAGFAVSYPKYCGYWY